MIPHSLVTETEDYVPPQNVLPHLNTNVNPSAIIKKTQVSAPKRKASDLATTDLNANQIADMTQKKYKKSKK